MELAWKSGESGGQGEMFILLLEILGELGATACGSLSMKDVVRFFRDAL